MTPDGGQVRLGDLVTIKHGWPFASEHFSTELSGGPIVVAIGNFRYTGGFRFEESDVKEYKGKYPKEYELAPGDVLIVMTCQTPGGEILGIPAQIPDDGRCYLHNQRIGKVVPRDGVDIDLRYLYYLFLWRELNQELVASATGTKIVHTAPSRIEAFCFTLPPRHMQQAIGAILRALDDKIELNRKMNRTLEELASALFKSWFVDFDPVQAKIDGRSPDGVPANIARLFPAEFEDSTIGPIPKGWRVCSIADIAKNVRRHASPSEAGPDTAYIGLEHMPRRQLTLDNWGRADSVTSNKFRFCAGEYLFGRLRPYFHKVGVALLDGVCSTDILVIAPQIPALRSLVLGHITSKKLIDFSDAGSEGTRMPRTNWGRIGSWLLALPDLEVAESHSDIIDTLLMRAGANVRENLTLAKLRDTLLPALMSGEVTIKRAEKLVGEAT